MSQVDLSQIILNLKILPVVIRSMTGSQIHHGKTKDNKLFTIVAIPPGVSVVIVL